MKTLKTALSLVLMFCLLLSLGAAAFADLVDVNPVDTRPPLGPGGVPGNLDGNPEINYNVAIGGEHSISVNPGSQAQLEDPGSGTDGGGTPPQVSDLDLGTIGGGSGTDLPANPAPAAVIPDVVPEDTTVEENPSGNTVTTNNGTVETNNGTVETNKGKVTTNNGTIENNDGVVITNGTTGIITENNYSLGTNNGTVSKNNTFIFDNYGTVLSSNEFSTVENNFPGGRVEGGIVRNNGGDYVFQELVRNNFGGNILVNNQVIPNPVATGIALNQFSYGVEITAENASVEGAANLTEFDGKYWMNDKTGDTDTGSITVKPAENFTLEPSSVSVAGGDSACLTVDADNSGGLLLTIRKLFSSLKLTVTGKASTPAPDPDPDPDPDPQPDPKPDPKPEPKPVAAAANDWSDGYANFCKAVVRQIKNAEQDGTVTVDGTGWAGFQRMVFEALAGRPDVTLVVKYGTNRELTVQAGTDVLKLIGNAQDVSFAKLARLVG